MSLTTLLSLKVAFFVVRIYSEAHVEEEQPPLPVGRRSRFFAWARRGRELPQRISFIFLAQTVYE